MRITKLTAKERPVHFELNHGARLLTGSNGVAHKLGNKEYLVLQKLTETPGQLVTSDELLNVAWKHSFEAPLEYVSKTISDLRGKLGDTERARRFIDTANRGYVLIANCEHSEMPDDNEHDLPEPAVKGRVDGQALLRDLIKRGRVALVVPEIRSWSIGKTRLLTLDVSLTNAGTAPAIQGWLSLYADGVEETKLLATLLPNERTSVSIAGRLSPDAFRRRNPVLLIQAMYITPDGHLISDDTNVELEWKSLGKQTDVVGCRYSSKRYIHSAGFKLKEGEFD